MQEIFVEAFASNPDAYSDFLINSGICIGVFAGFFFGVLISGFFVLLDFYSDWRRDRKAKKSGKLSTEDRLELLEDKIDSLADIVISTSEEVK